MISIELEYVRKIGRLPEEVPDDELQPHIDAAVRRVKGLLRGIAPSRKDDLERVREAMACYAIAYALPALNAFFLSNAENVPRQVSETDYVFYDLNSVLKLAQRYELRAAEALRDIRSGGTVGVKVV